MSVPELTLANLTTGLKTFSARYQALDVFIADVAELRELANGQPVPGLHQFDQDSFVFENEGAGYRLQFFFSEGVAQLTRHDCSVSQQTNMDTSVVSEMLRAGLSFQEHGYSECSLLLGLLVGAVFGGSTGLESFRRVCALCFDPVEQQWRAYDGGLVRWLKSALAPLSVIAGLSR